MQQLQDLKLHYYELGMDEDETMFSPGPNQMSYLWAPDAGQGLNRLAG